MQVQIDGQRKPFTDSTPGKKGKILCEQKADRWIETRVVNENTRSEIILDSWYEDLKAATSRGHYQQYEKYIRLYIKPLIGTKKIGSLNQNDLQKIINFAYSKKRANDKKLAEKTLKNIRACIMSFIKYCRGSKSTTWHPETLTIPAGAAQSVKTIADISDINILFNVTTRKRYGKTVEDFYIHAYRFAVLTGMRPGELIGLRRSDIKGSKVTIFQSINIFDEITQGKNKNARRTYTLDNHALQVLEDQYNMLASLSLLSPYVFPDYDLSHIKEKRLYTAWKRYCADNNITNATTPYELRHTFVSVNTNMPDGLKDLVIGHSKNFDTHGTYGHEKAGDMEAAAAHINTAFTKILGW